MAMKQETNNLIPRLVFHYTNEAGNLSPASTKEMHISMVSAIL